MSYDFFEIDDLEEEKEDFKKTSRKTEKKKERCEYCGKLFTNLKAHLRNCKDNPENIRGSKDRIQSFTDKAELRLLFELREQFIKALTPEYEARIKLNKEELENIEKIYDIFGGTDLYQFFYQTLSGKKIRGSIPYIIDQCIEMLRKHKIYYLFHRTKWKKKSFNNQ